MRRFLSWLVRNLVAALILLVPFGVVAYFTELEFSRTVGGEEVRTATGLLVKVAK